VEQGSVFASPNFVDHIWLKVNVKGPRHMFASARLGEKCAEATISPWSAVSETAIGLDERLSVID
jgi:hypothetical protein